jgi:hypothetical protein
MPSAGTVTQALASLRELSPLAQRSESRSPSSGLYYLEAFVVQEILDDKKPPHFIFSFKLNATFSIDVLEVTAWRVTMLVGVTARARVRAFVCATVCTMCHGVRLRALDWHFDHGHGQKLNVISRWISTWTGHFGSIRKPRFV